MPERDAPLYIDTSTMRALAQCDSQAWIRYYLGYVAQEERAPLLAGSAWHRAMETYYKGSGDIEGGMAAFEAAYTEWSEGNVPLGDRLHADNLRKIIRQWFITHPLDSLPFVILPDMIEIGFAFPLCDGIVFTGKIDAIVQDRESFHLYTNENKSTGRLNSIWAKQFKMDPQNSGYTWAAQQHLGDDTMIAGTFVTGIEFSKLPDSDRKCTGPKGHGVTFAECGDLHMNSTILITSRTPEQIAFWHRNAVMLAKRYRDLLTRYPDLKSLHFLAQQGQWNHSCTFCGFYDFCATGRPKAMVGSMLVHQPWSPFDYAFGDRLAQASGAKP